MQQILILGAGSTGKRYGAILKRLGQRVIFRDLDWTPQTPESNIDRVIIATPTDMHLEHLRVVLARFPEIPVLVEKPVSRWLPSAVDFNKWATTGWHSDRISIVCNWAFTHPDYDRNRCHTRWAPGHCDVTYFNWFTGGDSLEWDCCQLIYLAHEADVVLGSGPKFDCIINGMPITLSDIDESYCRMLVAWLHYPGELWNLNDAVAMTKKVSEKLNTRGLPCGL